MQAQKKARHSPQRGSPGRKNSREIEPAYATAVEAAAYLRVSRGLIVKLIKAGEVPCRQFGKIYRIPWEWLRKQAPQ
jgi:excisionase family DNA binding protein